MELIYFYSFLFFSFLICLFLTGFDLKRRSPFFLFWLVIIFLILIPSLLDPFNKIVLPHSFASTIIIDDSSLIIYSFYIFIVLFLFLSLYFIFYILFDNKHKVKYLKDVVSGGDKKYYYYLIFLASSIIGFYGFYSQFGFALFSDFNFTTRREVSSVLSSFLLSYPFMVCCGLLAYFLINKKYVWVLTVLFFYLTLYFVFGGSRQPLIALVFPIISFYVLGDKRINYKFLISTSFILFFGQYIFDVLKYLRNLPSFNDRILVIFNPSEMITYLQGIEGSESNIRYAFYYLIQNSSAQNGYFGFEYFLRSMLFWLPSSMDFLNIKPKDFEYKIFYDFMNGHEGSMHPTIFGSIYADSGWFFYPWIIFLGSIFYFLPIYIRRYSGIVYFCIWSTLLFYSFMLARGSIYGSIVVIAFTVFFGFFVQKIKFKLDSK